MKFGRRKWWKRGRKSWIIVGRKTSGDAKTSSSRRHSHKYQSFALLVNFFFAPFCLTNSSPILPFDIPNSINFLSIDEFCFLDAIRFFVKSFQNPSSAIFYFSHVFDRRFLLLPRSLENKILRPRFLLLFLHLIAANISFPLFCLRAKKFFFVYFRY